MLCRELKWVACSKIANCFVSGSAALLGDPNFPKILNPAKHGERILRFQELYQQYSRLDLSSDFDRPTAIDGLQQRLLSTMGVQGGFGILDDLSKPGILRRSLLWHRAIGVDRSKPIVFPHDQESVPSWSWMSRSGGIDYFSLTWNGYDWQEIRSPWSSSTGTPSKNKLVGMVQALDAEKIASGIIFDDPADSVHPNPMAIVLGIEKGSKAIRDKKHYMLVVKPTGTLDSDGNRLYERIGAGHVLGHYLGEEATSGSLI